MQAWLVATYTKSRDTAAARPVRTRGTSLMRTHCCPGVGRWVLSTT